MTHPNSGLPAFRLDDQVAVVTGGGSGIGRAAALAMARVGAHVCVLDQNADAAQQVAEEIRSLGEPGSIKSMAACVDVTDENQVEQAMAKAVETLGDLAILINCAGIAIRKPTVDLPLGEWQKVIDVNQTGAFLCARHAARKMLAAGHGGSIINVASINGLSGGGIYPNISYQTSKGAVVNMTRAMAVEWAGDNIRVNAVAPTWVRTPFISALTEQPDIVSEIERLTPLGRLAETDDVAHAVVYLASPAAAMVTGHILVVDGGFLAQ